tara:strand:- start:2161 stop:3276 length:1116 start_codon:yes stop_codon:yes gene_type:complete
MLEFLFDTGEVCYYKDNKNNYYAINYSYIDKDIFREYADVKPTYSYRDEDGDVCHEYDDDMWDLDSDIIQGYVDDYIKYKNPFAENGDIASDEDIFKVIEDDNGWHEDLTELLNPGLKTFGLDEKIHELPNYYKDQSAKFNLYKNCIISDCIRRGYKWEEHQHNLAHKYLNSESVVVEVGAHIGTLTVILSKLSKNVHSYEPLKQSYDLLNKNLLLNNCKNVKTYQKGVGDEIGNTKVGFISDGNCGATILSGGAVQKHWYNKTDIDVDLITLDSLKLDRLDYLKIDVEGYEEKVIKGGLKLINKYKPVIVMECMEDYDLGTIIRDETLEIKFKNLLELGYTYKNLITECNADEEEKIWDVLFIPTEITEK